MPILFDGWADILVSAALAMMVSGLVVYRWQRHRYEELLQQLAEQAVELDDLRVRYEPLTALAEQLQQQLDTSRLAVHEQELEATRWKERANALQLQWQRQQQQVQQQEQQHRERIQHQEAQMREQQERLMQQQREQLESFQQKSRDQLNLLQTQLRQSQAELAREQQARVLEQQHSEEKLALLQANREQLLKDFESLSHKVFEQKQQQFSEHSRLSLDAVLNPFREQLDGLRRKVEDVYVADSKDRAALQNQIGELHRLNQQITSEAHALTTALRGEHKTQGNWGEMVLENVLERSGLRKGEEYRREQSFTDEDGQTLRPDVIVDLPDGKHLIIDSKVSLTAYTDYVNADDDSSRAAAIRRHVESVRAHIRGLGNKAYQQLPGLNSPEMVFMFMPVEPAFVLAFQQDESLFSQAFEQKIVVVTPTTLLATLRTVASLWALERRNRNTEKLADQARRLYDKLVVVVDKFDKVGNQLESVNRSWDDAWKSLKSGRGNLISQADAFVTLGVRVKKELGRQLREEANADHELHEALEQQAPLPLEDADDAAEVRV